VAPNIEFLEAPLELNDWGRFENTDVVAIDVATQMKCSFVIEKKLCCHDSQLSL